MLAAFYAAATGVATPLVTAYLRHRCRHGKEDPGRLAERFGIPFLPRPAGPLVWVHAASVGEALSVRELIDRLLRQRPALSVLMTTGTVAAARLIGPQLPARALHQYAPVDLPAAVARFLDHWRPDLALWVESELWPNLVLAARRRGMPAVLANARLSARSAARWRLAPGLAREVLSSFALCLAPDAEQAERFRGLGAVDVVPIGDLKAAADELPVDPRALRALQGEVGDRPVWLAASTHPGEEDAAAAAHRRIARDHPDLLTIIAPRHPIRGDTIAAALRAQKLRVVRRSDGAPIAPATDIYLADTMGELGLFYRLADTAFIGGSLAGNGGHNPFEAARLDCAILHGPDMTNCAAMAAALAAGGAAETVRDAATLATAVSRLIAEPGLRAQRAAAARAVAERGRVVLDTALERLAPFLDPLAPVAAAALRQPRPRLAAIADAGP